MAASPSSTTMWGARCMGRPPVSGRCSLLRLPHPQHQFAAPLKAFGRPHLGGPVVLGHGAGTRRDGDPGLFRRRVDVDVGRTVRGFVERADADEAHRITATGVVAPY